MTANFQQEGGLWRLGVCESRPVYGYFGAIEGAERGHVYELAGRRIVSEIA